MRASEIKSPTDLATINRFWASANKSGECWVWQKSLKIGGYGQFNCQGAILQAHRLAYAIAHGCAPKNRLVCHRCDNRRCINPSHLFLGSYTDNNRDMFQKGRGYVFDGTHALGEKNVNAKMTADKAWEAVWLRSCGLSLQEIGDRYGVSATVICGILNGKIWRHAVTMLVEKGRAPPSHSLGLRKAGDGNGNAKLTDAKVMEIIWLRSQGLTMAVLGRRYSVSKSVVKAILAGKIWRHITASLVSHTTGLRNDVTRAGTPTAKNA